MLQKLPNKITAMYTAPMPDHAFAAFLINRINHLEDAINDPVLIKVIGADIINAEYNFCMQHIALATEKTITQILTPIKNIYHANPGTKRDKGF